MAAGGLVVAGDEAVVVAGSGSIGCWVRLIWLGDGAEAEVPIGRAWAPRSFDGNAIRLMHAAVSARDLSSKAAAQQSIRFVYCIISLGSYVCCNLCWSKTPAGTSMLQTAFFMPLCTHAGACLCPYLPSPSSQHHSQLTPVVRPSTHKAAAGRGRRQRGAAGGRARGVGAGGGAGVRYGRPVPGPARAQP